MADGDPTTALWNWAVAGHFDADRIRGAIAGTLERSVVPLGDDGAVLCDVYPVGGDFPTLVDVYLAPAGVVEAHAASAVAVRLGAAVLLPDDSLNPSRYVCAEPDGTLSLVHVDETETDDGPERRNARPCTGECQEPRRPAAA
ncbi:hypothetical protein [Actinoplanes sp. TBRC 11911]|uniref:hypothetical protein n=1 Tax=Actinoplanes sp. TBRC 11911 TaxID=2729386 RepID=UPI0020070932|nr:hypothetical protein [Actinoplanes sp. TBRC 11911]